MTLAPSDARKAMAEGLHNFPDEELARRALAGSAPCYEEIVRRYQVPLMRFLVKRFPSRRDAEDILQDAFLKAWQSLHLFDPQYSFRTWLYTIAYRLAVSRGRRLAVEEPLATFDLRSDEPAPEFAAAADDDRRSLWARAREVLSDEQFTALWLHYVDDVPAGDIARILNRSWVSVKTLMHRARKKLMPYLVDDPSQAEPAPPRLAAVALSVSPQPDRPAIRPAVQAGEP
jgi:RNA polymerase sigma-70 factor (ECF subfamily)